MHYALTSHIDDKKPKHTAVHPNTHPRPQSPYPTEGSGDPTRPQDQNTLPPHPNEQHPTDDPKGGTNRIHPTNRSTQAQKTIEKKLENNNNNPNPHHLLYHHMYHMHPTWLPKNDAYNEKDTNNALQNKRC